MSAAVDWRASSSGPRRVSTVCRDDDTAMLIAATSTSPRPEHRDGDRPQSHGQLLVLDRVALLADDREARIQLCPAADRVRAGVAAERVGPDPGVEVLG